MIIEIKRKKSAPPLTIYAIQWIPWLMLLVMILISVSGFFLPTWVQYLPFLASALFLGLPHGAVDHLVPFWVNREQVSRRKMVGFVLLYLSLSGLYMAWWYINSTFAFIFFIGMTWFHWGQGDLYALVGSLRVRHLDSRRLRIATLLVRGGMPMFVPLLAFPEIYKGVASDTIGLFLPNNATNVAWFFGPEALQYGAFIFGTLVLSVLIWGWLACPGEARHGWWQDAFEVILLLAFFALVPPLLAVGLYFCLWHAIRHISRLQMLKHTLDQRQNSGDLWPHWGDFFKDSMPLTGAALLLLGLLYLAVPQTPQTLNAHLGLYLAFIAALTFPHTLLVTWLDFREGIWQAEKH